MPATAPAPDLPPGPRLALVIATSSYADTSLAQLRSPARDAADLAAVLADPDIGGFAVTSLSDRSAHEIRLGVEDFLSGRGTDDLLLVYLSCHGVRDNRGRLYFAATDTHKTRLASTGVESAWLLDQLDECRARRQVLILDCCFSGAFAHRTKGGTDLDLQRHLVGHGRGRAVLTASRAGEYSFEGEPLPDAATTAGSVFTTGLVEGLRTGAADRDHDGYISVEDVYDYAYTHVQTRGAAQTPQRWLYGAEGRIWLARNPAGRTVTSPALPESLRLALDSPHPEVRLGAVNTLGEWLTDDDPGPVRAARRELERVADNDIPRVAGTARRLLAGGAVPPPAVPPTAALPTTAAPTAVAATTAATTTVAPTAIAPTTVSPAAVGGAVVAEPAPPPSGRWPGAPRLVGTLRGHRGDVLAVTFRPDGKTLASAGADQTVRLWDPRTGRHQRQIATGGMARVRGVAFSPEDWFLVIAGSQTIVVRQFGPERDLPTHVLTGHTGDVLAVALGPGSPPAANYRTQPSAGAERFLRLATASADHTVRLWDPLTGRHLHTLTGHTAEVLAVAVRPVGRMLATAGADQTVRLWDPVTGWHLRKLTGHTGAVRAVAFSGDGRLLATAGDDRTVRLWDPTICRRVLADQGGVVRALALRPDGRLLVTAGDDRLVRLWDPATGRLLHTLTGHSGAVRAVAFSRDGRLLATAGNDRTVLLWEFAPTDQA